jgi:hypothetical protein
VILWACSGCNRKKSALEDDISAITMHFHVAGLRGMDDAILQKEAVRKSVRSFSRKTRKSVAESSSAVRVSTPLGADGTITSSFTAPPQVDDARADELARMQMMAFFYVLTYQEAIRIGHWWPGGFYPLHGTIKTDWGNAIHRAFTKEVQLWDYRLIGTTAHGYYRVMIRRHPKAECWAWGVEWNDSYRLIGFFGDFDIAKGISEKLPELPVHTFAQGPNHWVRFREEQPLPEDADTMFTLPD